MFSTREVLRALNETNPKSPITEDRLRNVIRRGETSAPRTFAGRYAWTTDNIVDMAQCLKINPPSFCSEESQNEQIDLKKGDPPLGTSA